MENDSLFLNESFSSNKFFNIIKNPTLLVLFFIVAGITLVLIPLPGFLLDFFMIINVILSLMIIITVISSKNNLDFSIFPTMLLLTTAFRLIINISSTRLILSDGLAFDGNVVKGFAEFVTGGSYLIGIVIFSIIIVVQYLVITKGANRAGEVSARFKLDSLPGKQIAIDADLNAGIINEKEAIERRKLVQQEADFYGSMDGASKFISGEVIASIVIVLINIIGGIIIGLVIRDEGLSVAAESYVKFAIGDGLVAAIPSLIIAISSGIIVTRSSSDKRISDDIYSQIFSNPIAFYFIGIFVFIVGILPGFPWMVFSPLSLLFFFTGYQVYKKLQKKQLNEEVQDSEEYDSQEEDLSPENIINNLQVEKLEVELGYELIYIADIKQGGDLLERIKKSRKQMALELGLVIPQVRISDNLQLSGDEYTIKINGSMIAGGKVFTEKLLAINTSGKEVKMNLPKIIDPVFNLPAYWIEQKDKLLAEKKGFTIADIPTIVVTHLVQVIRENANEILGRKDIQMILDSVKKNNPILIDELKNSQVSLGDIQKILSELLLDDISIRDISNILEVISDYSKDNVISKDLIIEKVRQKLSRQISNQLADSQRNINFIILDEKWETYLYRALQEEGKNGYANITSEKLSSLLKKVEISINLIGKKGYQPILLVESHTRKSLKSILSKEFKGLKIVAKEEIADGFKLNVLNKISFD